MVHRSASVSRAAPGLALLLVLGGAAGCASPGATGPAPTIPATTVPTVAASPTPAITAAPTEAARPSGTLAWPTDFQIEMAGRYFTSPPFVIPFSFEITEPGWRSGHLNPVFLDIQRWDGVPLDAWPTRILGFGWPSNFTGPDGKVPVANLTPETAFDLLTDRRYLTMTNRAAVELFGRDGVRADFTAAINRIPIFGDEEDDFGLGPQLDLRLAAVPHGDGLLVILVQAAPEDLDAAWAQAVAMLDTYQHLEAAPPGA